MKRNDFKCEYYLPEDELTDVEIVLRLCFHDFAYGVGEDGRTVIRTNAEPDEFRRIRGRAKCLRLYDETGMEHMTEEEAADVLWCSCFDHFYAKEGAKVVVKGFEKDFSDW